MAKNGLTRDASVEQNTTLIGTIKGRITRLRDGKVVVFDSNNVFRRTTPEGALQVFGLMRHPEADVDLRAEFQLADKDAPTGEYLVGTNAVSALFILFPLGVGYEYRAEAGKIILQNHAPAEVRINGKLEFRTEDKFGDQYDVDLVFEATGER